MQDYNQFVTAINKIFDYLSKLRAGWNSIDNHNYIDAIEDFKTAITNNADVFKQPRRELDPEEKRELEERAAQEASELAQKQQEMAEAQARKQQAEAANQQGNQQAVPSTNPMVETLAEDLPVEANSAQTQPQQQTPANAMVPPQGIPEIVNVPGSQQEKALPDLSIPQDDELEVEEEISGDEENQEIDESIIEAPQPIPSLVGAKEKGLES